MYTCELDGHTFICPTKYYVCRPKPKHFPTLLLTLWHIFGRVVVIECPVSVSEISHPAAPDHIQCPYIF